MSIIVPLPEVKTGEQDGWLAKGKRTEHGHIVSETIGVFASWIDADQACDAYHTQHRHSLSCSIVKHYVEETNERETE